MQSRLASDRQDPDSVDGDDPVPSSRIGQAEAWRRRHKVAVGGVAGGLAAAWTEIAGFTPVALAAAFLVAVLARLAFPLADRIRR